MAKNKFNQSWLHDHINDPYVKLAQREGYRARAAYKLKEIDEREKLIKPGMTVVDLGSTPGSWSQYVRTVLFGRITAKPTAAATSPAETSPATPSKPNKSRIIAVDMLPMEPITDVTFIEGDFREEEVLQRIQALLGGERVDLVLSDMAPNLSGIELADTARMQHVCELALEFAEAHLKPQGALLVKAFHGSGYSQIIELFKKHFVVVKPIKPKASRDKSAETFILGRRPKR